MSVRAGTACADSRQGALHPPARVSRLPGPLVGCAGRASLTHSHPAGIFRRPKSSKPGRPAHVWESPSRAPASPGSVPSADVTTPNWVSAFSLLTLASGR
jgi:hypothetical protein